MPTKQDKEQLLKAMSDNQICFFGAWDGELLIGCCSISMVFSTFNYEQSGVFDDFYILP